MEGAITGQIAVGRYVLRIGDECGVVVREASRTERAHIRPRPTPVLLRPKLIRGLLDRRIELAGALSALDAGLPIEASGERGIGKTALLRHLAYHPRAGSFADGVVYVTARHQSADDLLQVLFEAFNESDEPCKPTDAEIRRGIQEKQALILLDEVHLKQEDLERVLDSAPQSAFVVATRERCLWGEVRSLALNGLAVENALLLMEREIERPLGAAERSAAADLCKAIEGHPLRLLQAAALIRERGTPLDGWLPADSPEGLLTELLASIDEKQRRALLALTALPGAPLRLQHLSGISEVTDIESAVMPLVRRGLVVSSQSKHRLAAGVADRLRRTCDLNPWVNRAITYFTAWAERHQRSADILLEESEALLRVQQCALDARRWGEVLLLGQRLEGALVIGVRWGAWATILERCLVAAKATANRSAEAWARHEIGTRALCGGNSAQARAELGQALRLREALQEEAAASATRRNLGLVLASLADESHDPLALPLATAVDVGVLPHREVNRPAARASSAAGAGALLLTGVLSAIVGWFGYWTIAWGLSPYQTAREAPPSLARAVPEHSKPPELPAARLYSEFPATPADPSSVPPPEEAAAERASIRIFTARPGSIATSGRAGLCYAIDGASQARIEPDIGEVSPSTTFTCLRVAPPRTTRYELTAAGRDGHQVSQQLVIVVR